MPSFRDPTLSWSDVTPQRSYLDRRAVLAGMAATAGLGLLGGPAFAGDKLDAAANPAFQAEDKPTAKDAILSYNNYYEFGTGKDDPARTAGQLKTKPWTVKVEGLCDRPGEYALEDFLKPSKLEERVYRHRCVEAWSMVIPWIGIPLADVIQRAQPQSAAKFVAFETLLRPSEMPGVRGLLPILDWPYTEGLRLDEALNPLAFLATGLYGETLENQNGAPLRLVLPWKYGFKSIKAIVKVSFVDKQPPTAWNKQAPSEYGFYSNVNPDVDHPRWSQRKERRIGDILKRNTLPFNGYAEQVASLYSGMDLKANF